MVIAFVNAPVCGAAVTISTVIGITSSFSSFAQIVSNVTVGVYCRVLELLLTARTLVVLRLLCCSAREGCALSGLDIRQSLTVTSFQYCRATSLSRSP